MDDGIADVGEFARMEGELQRAQGALSTFVRGFREQAASMRRLWREAVDDVLQQSARLTAGTADAGGNMGDLWRGMGLLAGLAARPGSGPAVDFIHPGVSRPDGALLPGALAALTEGRAAPVGVTIAPGAVQITAQQLDERVLAQAADQLVEQIHARLQFEDRRLGRV